MNSKKKVILIFSIVLLQVMIYCSKTEEEIMETRLREETEVRNMTLTQLMQLDVKE